MQFMGEVDTQVLFAFGTFFNEKLTKGQKLKATHSRIFESLRFLFSSEKSLRGEELGNINTRVDFKK